MPTRRRPVQEFEATQSEAGPRTVTLDSLIGGYNGYTSPDLLSPQFWAGASNIYAGQFGTIRRARWAPTFNNTATGYSANGFRIASMFSFLDLVNNVTWLMFENNDTIVATGPRWITRYPLAAWNQNFGSSQAQLLLNVWNIVDNIFSGQRFPLSLSLMNGPYSRIVLNNIILEANGLFRSKVLIGVSSFYNGAFNNSPLLEFWGIDAPDSSPQITLSAGTSATIAVAPTGAVRTANVVTITATAPLPANFVVGAFVNISGVTDTSFNTATGTAVQLASVSTPSFTFSQVGPDATSGGGTATIGITKTVGRSYQYAWENAMTGHVSAPSPASQYVKYANQTGSIACIQAGTIATGGIGSQTVVGTNTNFSPAWVGKALYYSGTALYNQTPFVTAVAGPTSMTVSLGAIAALGGRQFQVIDPQVTHVRLYETGDGGSVYFKTARNNLSTPVNFALLTFSDTANSEPPNQPFSSELTQIYNVPPPLGTFVQDYQGRALTYGVTANPQTFFYSNIEATVVGQGAESSAPLNTVTMPIGDGALNGSANLPTGLLIWSNRQDMFKLTGLLTDNTVANAQQLGATIQRLPYKIGCGSAYATAVTPLGAMWLSSDREVWLFTDHYAPKNVGKPVQDVLNRINGARLAFAKMTYYKRGDRSWLALAVALDSSTFNNKLLLLDLDLLASNGQPSFFTFDMATNQPTWYQFDVNCESICTSYDANSINHLLVGDVDLITDVDWQPGYYTIATEQNVAGSNKLHAFGNEDPHMVKTFQWMRALTNQIPANLAAQGWGFSVDAFDDDAFVIGVNANTTLLVPGTDSPATTRGLEFSPALFKFGGVKPIKGRRFQIGTTFPSTPGLWELRGFEVSYENIVGI